MTALGSLNTELLSVPIAFDTPGIFAGIDLGYTGVDGDMVIGFAWRIVEEWDGTLPGGFVYFQGADLMSSGGLFGSSPADMTVDGAPGAGFGCEGPGGGSSGVAGIFTATVPVFVTVGVALKVRIANSNDLSDPAPTQGAGRIIVAIGRA
jgi:hypothetical protein